MNKLLERLVTMTMTQIFMISIAVGGVYYWLVYDDGALMDTTIVSLTTEKNTQETKRKDTDATLKEEKRIKALVGTLGTQFQEIAKRLPNQLSMIDMTRQIQIFRV